MKKKIMLRCALGFPIGITIGQIISIIISLIWAKGYYAPCVPELVTAMGNEINAIILQTALYALLGMGFSASSVIWEIDHWNLVKQTGIYFLIVSAFMMPIAYVNYWMEHSFTGLISYFGIFVLIFIIVWVIQFTIGRNNVRKMNENLQSYRKR